MNKISLVFLFLFLIKNSKAQDSLIINGTINKVFDDKTIVLNSSHPVEYSNLEQPLIREESIIKDGKFHFSAKTSENEFYYISIKGMPGKDKLYVLLSPSNTQIHILDTLIQKYEIINNEIDQAYRATIPLRSRGKYTQQELDSVDIAFIKKNPASPLNVFFLASLIRSVPEKAFLDVWALVPDSLKTNSVGKELTFFKDNLFVGKQLPDFVLPDTSGRPIRITDFRGKYILLEFWASWCIPCRDESPHLIKAYSKYQNKNFDILGISLDTDQKAWIEAIKYDKLTWPQVSSLTDAENNVVKKMFKIISIPRNYLVDPRGKIIEKDLKAKDLAGILSRLGL